MLRIEVQGTKEAIEKINVVEKLLNSKGLKEYLAQQMISVINKIADERLSYDENYVKHNKYELRDDGILVYNDVTNESGDHYSLILEYGSGLYAEQEHIGNTPTFKATGNMYWFVPEEEAPELFEYPYERIETEDGVLYKVYGQTPKHIYEDAAEIIQKTATVWIKDYLVKELGGKK